MSVCTAWVSTPLRLPRDVPPPPSRAGRLPLAGQHPLHAPKMLAPPPTPQPHPEPPPPPPAAPAAASRHASGGLRQLCCSPLAARDYSAGFMPNDGVPQRAQGVLVTACSRCAAEDHRALQPLWRRAARAAPPASAGTPASAISAGSRPGRLTTLLRRCLHRTGALPAQARSSCRSRGRVKGPCPQQSVPGRRTLRHAQMAELQPLSGKPMWWLAQGGRQCLSEGVLTPCNRRVTRLPRIERCERPRAGIASRRSRACGHPALVAASREGAAGACSRGGLSVL